MLIFLSTHKNSESKTHRYSVRSVRLNGESGDTGDLGSVEPGNATTLSMVSGKAGVVASNGIPCFVEITLRGGADAPPPLCSDSSAS